MLNAQGPTGEMSLQQMLHQGRFLFFLLEVDSKDLRYRVDSLLMRKFFYCVLCPPRHFQCQCLCYSYEEAVSLWHVDSKRKGA